MPVLQLLYTVLQVLSLAFGRHRLRGNSFNFGFRHGISGNTATYLGLYRLLRIIQEVKSWGKDIYFPYLASILAKVVGQ
jgi:hypothetical protein